MPSYADEFAARHPDWQRRNNAGPVRLTISRGDSYRGPDGRLTFAEKWEQEEIMDVEVVSSVDAETDSQQLGIQSDQDLSLVDTIRERLGNGRQKGARLRAFSLLIVDTNALLSTLPFLKALTSQCLERNVFALSNAAISPSPIALIIPHVVLSELDNLKTSSNGSLASTARAANTWLLSVLQSQKKHMYDDVTEGGTRRVNIPERSWVLHVENTAHVNAFGGDHSGLTNDEQIVRLCVSLKSHSGFEVFFWSDDINARTRAEVENLATFSFRDIAQSAGDDPKELVKLANDVIEQWQSQITGTADEDDSEDKMEEDRDVDVAAGNTTHRFSSDTSIDRASTDKRKNRTTQHSMYAVHTPSTRTTRSMAANRPTHNQHPTDRHHISIPRDSRQRQHITHQYSNDKSTASSMWAV